MFPTYAELTLSIPANGNLPLPFGGNFITCLAAGANFQLAMDSEPATTFREGLSFQVPAGRAFSRLDLQNPTGSAIIVTLGIGTGDLRDNRSTIGGTVTTSEERGATIAQYRVNVTTTATLIAAANANRKSLIIKAWPDNGGSASLGGSDVSSSDVAKDGVRLDAGETLTLTDYTGALYGDATGGVQTLGVIEISA